LILSPLAHLLNLITSKNFPNAWKCSKVVPVAKVKDPGWLKDYRPISIQPALSKALENIMKDQIVAFCNEKGLLNRFQLVSGQDTAQPRLFSKLQMTSRWKWIVNSLPFLHFLISLRLLTPFHKLKTVFFFSDSAIEVIKAYLTDRT
jgi:hypothetical protein